MPRTIEPWGNLDEFDKWVKERGEGALERFRKRQLYGLKIQSQWAPRTIKEALRARLISRRVNTPRLPYSQNSDSQVYE